MDILSNTIFYGFIGVFGAGIVLGTLILFSSIFSIKVRTILLRDFRDSSNTSVFPSITTLFFLMFSNYYGYLDSSDINLILLMILVLTGIVGLINFIVMNPNKFLRSIITFVMYLWIYNYYF